MIDETPASMAASKGFRWYPNASPITSAKSSTTDMSPSVASPSFSACSPRAAAAMPASFGNGENAPADSLMPARACGSMWLRAFDLYSAGMPRRVASLFSWIAFMNSAASRG